ncbi:MAG: single-stranded DNA-binding protein [Spirochaetaceae bacterium]
MNSLNSLLLEGNLVKDPVERRTSGDSLVCSFTVAVNRSYKKEEDYVKEVSYFDVDVWGSVAESCIKHLCKGRGVRVVGRLKQDRWLDDQEQMHSRIKVVAEHVEFKPIFTGEKVEVQQTEDEVIEVTV